MIEGAQAAMEQGLLRRVPLRIRFQSVWRRAGHMSQFMNHDRHHEPDVATIGAGGNRDLLRRRIGVEAIEVGERTGVEVDPDVLVLPNLVETNRLSRL